MGKCDYYKVITLICRQPDRSNLSNQSYNFFFTQRKYRPKFVTLFVATPICEHKAACTLFSLDIFLSPVCCSIHFHYSMGVVVSCMCLLKQSRLKRGTCGKQQIQLRRYRNKKQNASTGKSNTFTTLTYNLRLPSLICSYVALSNNS